MDFPKTISLLHRKMNMELNERLMDLGLSNAQSGLLKFLYNNGEMTQADLCKQIKIDKSTVAKMLSRLENDGFVVKRVNPEDNRSFLVSLTQKAIKIIPKINMTLSEWTKDVTSSFSGEEKDFFYKMLDRVAHQATSIVSNNE